MYLFSANKASEMIPGGDKPCVSWPTPGSNVSRLPQSWLLNLGARDLQQSPSSSLASLPSLLIILPLLLCFLEGVPLPESPCGR